jgi:opacity protein-like surface antigen
MMAKLIVAAALVAAGANAASAQSVERGYVVGDGGFAVAPDGTSGDVVGEVGVRVTPRFSVFGDIGQFHNLQPSSAGPLIDAATTAAAANGVVVSGAARVPALYTLGGVRYDTLPYGRLQPFVFGGAGFARMTTNATFTYSSGTITGITPNVGDDVTPQVESMGAFTPPAASTAFMFSLGGGVETPIAPHIAAEVGYRFSRVSADTPLNAQSVLFGLRYGF